MNECAVIFDTLDVLEAAGSKWNFLPFRPGLVGGHCIGVDSYYLTYKAEMMGYQPDVILSRRQINDGMGKFIAGKTVRMLIDAGVKVKGSRVLALGLAFKENCSDIRNAKAVDVIWELESFGVEVLVCDPLVDSEQSYKEYNVQLIDVDEIDVSIDAIVAIVAHDVFAEVPYSRWAEITRNNAPFIDVKSVFNKRNLQSMGFDVWCL
ncbi:MAG: UDP binding domain-containing protein [Ghiorsea sp.]|nr:UDP binding domain-containing protein [Ghiorsea sp.]